MDVPQPRKSIRLSAQNYLGRQTYFVTMCCFRRNRVFDVPAACDSILSLLCSESAARDFAILAYCVMPDHLHFLAEGVQPASDLLGFLKSFKIKSSRWFAPGNNGALWQRGYYEHVLRKAERSEQVAWYIWLNPVRKALVATPQEYAFSGSFAGLKMPSAWTKANWCPPWKRSRD